MARQYVTEQGIAAQNALADALSQVGQQFNENIFFWQIKALAAEPV
jgi:hypothetical protein